MSDHKETLARRTWLGGAATAGAAAVAVAVLPTGKQQPTQASAPSAAPPVESGGYRLTEHVRQYYASARV